ncbi:sodium/glutamate symporter [Natranaerofaba carboxydovora]|uniref:sodium/glutamate symporter n=1 Tax=Natranaerofaba carboxydovora TaxID=2742683 RepID=UPI001F1465F3|nr:sodium/glutamate symporter [Natranaerofaba carboxydovora]UMZ73616.1 Sodium/glutamate symporter [Natranaerofaba carboxydovora]
MSPEMISEAIEHPEVISAIMEGAPLAILKDFGLMALLIFIGKLLRTRVAFFQNFFIPPSIIAGFIGLIFGPQLIDVIPWSEAIANYAWLLVVILFATFPIGRKKVKGLKSIVNKAGPTFFFNKFAEVAQFAIGALLGITVFRIVWPDLHEGFAWMLPAGFAGGHGYATAIGTTFGQYGFEDPVTIGMTMATIGLLMAVFLGIFIIKQATKKGYTRIVDEVGNLPPSMTKGLVEEKDRQSMGSSTTSPMSIDPLAWHLALVLLVTLAGVYLTEWLGQFKVAGEPLYIPELATAVIFGFAFQALLERLNMAQYIDKEVITRIGSTVSDFMVGFGVASIQISVVLELWQPLLFLVIVGVGWLLFNLFYIAPRMLNNFWFERGIFNFGWCSGVVAFGVVLLRIVDPDYRSETLEDYGIAYIIFAWTQLVLTAFVPVFFVMAPEITTGLLIAAAVALLVLAKVAGFWYPADKTAPREGEAEKISGVKTDSQ